MFSDSQRLYLEQVLGTSVEAYRRPPTADLPPVHSVVVLTPTLSEEARALLNKILGSIKLESFAHLEGQRQAAAPHVLHFAPDAVLGRSATIHGTSWGFHDLERLLGPAAEVTQLKREVWTLLQTFAREVPCS